VTLSPPGAGHHLLAFTSARRFNGQFYLRPPGGLQVVVDTEGLALEPGEGGIWRSSRSGGPDREGLLAGLAGRLNENHPPLVPAFAEPLSGWCSWYCFGPRVTAVQVLANLDVITRAIPGLKYIQIDDGYQAAMGDWLETGDAFGGGVAGVLRQIREPGFEPAIWVAPFIAEKGSRVFREHPEWFVTDAEGRPLAADQVTFGGWRRGPWYAVDGTHPEARRHLENVFRTMREEWGCTYNDIKRTWARVEGTARQNRSATDRRSHRCGREARRLTLLLPPAAKASWRERTSGSSSARRGSGTPSVRAASAHVSRSPAARLIPSKP
jgi:alpha-galactosidase